MLEGENGETEWNIAPWTEYGRYEGRTSEKSRVRPAFVKYELGSVPGRTSLGYSDLGEGVPSARREGGMSNRPRARAPGETGVSENMLQLHST